MAKAFKIVLYKHGLQRWECLIRMTDGKRGSRCSVTKQKLVEIPRIEEIAFIVILTVHYS